MGYRVIILVPRGFSFTKFILEKICNLNFWIGIDKEDKVEDDKDSEDSDELGFLNDAGVEPLVWGQDIRVCTCVLLYESLVGQWVSTIILDFM